LVALLFGMCEGHGSEEEEKDGRSVCRYYLRGWCRNGKRCEFSHRRPLCRYGDRCRYGRWCRYSHKITPRVSRVGGTKPGKHNVRNRLWRDKRRVLMAEAKVSLVRIKELEAQQKLEEEQKSELHDAQKVKKLESRLRFVQEDKERLEQKLQRQKQADERLLNICRRRYELAEREAEKKQAELKKLEEKHHEEVAELCEEAVGERGMMECALKQEQQKNTKLEHALELERQKTLKLEHALELGNRRL